jgi:hypothetical protein
MVTVGGRAADSVVEVLAGTVVVDAAVDAGASEGVPGVSGAAAEAGCGLAVGRDSSARVPSQEKTESVKSERTKSPMPMVVWRTGLCTTTSCCEALTEVGGLGGTARPSVVKDATAGLEVSMV